MRKRSLSVTAGIMSFILSASLLFTSVDVLSVSAATSSAKHSRTLKAGLLHREAGTITDPVTTVYKPGQALRMAQAHGYKGSTIYSSRYDSYSTNYVYNRLTAREQQFWDDLDSVALSLLVSDTDCVRTEERYDDGSQYICYRSPAIDYSGLDEYDVERIYILFLYSNPQYYFLEYYTWGSYYPSICLTVYEAFATGTARRQATERFTATADSIIAGASAYSSDVDKLDYFSRTIDRKITYDTEANDSGFEVYNNPYHQSAYSIFCEDYSVCAGYSMAMEYLCNAVGIDCISVTSKYHQWDRVRLDDNWYNIDVTWSDDDEYGYVYYDYFLKSDDSYADDDPEYASYHETEEIWDDLLEPCTLDSDSEELSKGTIPTVTDRASAPVMIKSDSGYVLSSSTPGAHIFYTTDGSDPSEARTRSKLYTGKLSAKNPESIRAITVANEYLDSTVVSGVSSELTTPKVKKLTSPKSGKLTVRVSGLGDGTGYEIAYSTSKSSKSKKVRIGSSSSKTISGLKKGKTYYVWARTYRKIGSKTYYSSWSSPKKIKVKK